MIAPGSNISGLYFQLNGKRHLPGETIKLTDIGPQPHDRSNPGSTLVCITYNINPECCRTSDGANVGNWYYPNGSRVPRPHEGYSHYYRVGYFNQVRLTRSSNTIRPSGYYTCSVPDYGGNIWNASIYLSGK